MKNENHQWKLVKFGKYLVSVGVMTLVVGSSAVMASVSTNTVASKTNAVKSTIVKASWQANSTDTVKQNIASQNKSNDIDNYEVQWGDTLSTISQVTGISVNDLASRYGIPDANSIFAGVTLVHQKDFNSQVASITAAVPSIVTGISAATSTPAANGSSAATSTPAVNGSSAATSTPAVNDSSAATSTLAVNDSSAATSTPVVNDSSAATSTPVANGSSAPANNGSTTSTDKGSSTSAANGSTTSTDKGSSTSANNSSAASNDNGSGIKHAVPGSAQNPINPDTGTDAPNGAYFDNDGWN
ncbi:LysM peptidoglycan-binding domain-containing protein [Leuconostoc inhae]|uniref:LysM peptidoglycan-binding domain-containing protein n=1 Tax=Leuconostoc inhae TaxID=178001 RepID=UPI001C7DCBC1|nr:LysM peptidoglycan-binding domain-containing protein [Leuconostoc inhae]